MPSVKDALLNLAEQLPDDIGPAEQVIISQANPSYYMAKIHFGDEEEFEGYQIELASESDSEA